MLFRAGRKVAWPRPNVVLASQTGRWLSCESSEKRTFIFNDKKGPITIDFTLNEMAFDPTQDWPSQMEKRMASSEAKVAQMEKEMEAAKESATEVANKSLRMVKLATEDMAVAIEENVLKGMRNQLVDLKESLNKLSNEVSVSNAEKSKLEHYEDLRINLSFLELKIEDLLDRQDRVEKSIQQEDEDITNLYKKLDEYLQNDAKNSLDGVLEDRMGALRNEFKEDLRMLNVMQNELLQRINQALENLSLLEKKVADYGIEESLDYVAAKQVLLQSNLEEERRERQKLEEKMNTEVSSTASIESHFEAFQNNLDKAVNGRLAEVEEKVKLLKEKPTDGLLLRIEEVEEQMEELTDSVKTLYDFQEDITKEFSEFKMQSEARLAALEEKAKAKHIDSDSFEASPMELKDAGFEGGLGKLIKATRPFVEIMQQPSDYREALRVAYSRVEVIIGALEDVLPYITPSSQDAVQATLAAIKDFKTCLWFFAIAHPFRDFSLQALEPLVEDYKKAAESMRVCVAEFETVLLCRRPALHLTKVLKTKAMLQDVGETVEAVLMSASLKNLTENTSTSEDEG